MCIRSLTVDVSVSGSIAPAPNAAFRFCTHQQQQHINSNRKRSPTTKQATQKFLTSVVGRISVTFVVDVVNTDCSYFVVGAPTSFCLTGVVVAVVVVVVVVVSVVPVYVVDDLVVVVVVVALHLHAAHSLSSQ